MAILTAQGNRKNPFYTISHYAKINGVTVQTIYRWIKDGSIETTKIGNTTFVRLKAK